MTDTYYLYHPFILDENQPCGCCEEVYEYEEDYMNELEEFGGDHDGREFDSDGMRLEDAGETATPKEWAAREFKSGPVSGHLLVSVDWF